jgi:UDP-2,3-diacylglucosamine hydrolase
MSKNKIYFISDAHLGAPNSSRLPHIQEDALIDFFQAIREDAEALYIVGDLFDFWFEYRSVVPSHGAHVLFELHNLIQSGVRVIYIPGNHDIWLGHYLAKQVGVELPGHEVDVTHQGQRLYVAHGDGFRQDWKYKLSRKILDHPFCITLFRWLHPDIGAKLAHLMSRYSEFRVKRGDLNKMKTSAQIYIKGAAEKFAEGFDIVICGHYHHLINEPVESGTLVVLGDWMKYDSYAVLENGQISLKQWKTAPITAGDHT